MQDTLDVQVEPGNAHDDVVEVVLVRYEEASGSVVDEPLAVVRREELAEDAFVDCEKGKVLNVGVVLDRVANNVVHVVGLFPPSERDAAEGVSERDAPKEILAANVRNGVVADVVSQERELLPKERHEGRAAHVR